ncbi:EDE1 [Acrasis kona]|uniref:EDE1 n=1 Tax=Acrasis kona TaxID=1008807 RepID=A0AAW2YJ41_9EUKA
MGNLCGKSKNFEDDKPRPSESSPIISTSHQQYQTSKPNITNEINNTQIKPIEPVQQIVVEQKVVEPVVEQKEIQTNQDDINQSEIDALVQLDADQEAERQRLQEEELLREQELEIQREEELLRLQEQELLQEQEEEERRRQIEEEEYLRRSASFRINNELEKLTQEEDEYEKEQRELDERKRKRELLMKGASSPPPTDSYEATPVIEVVTEEPSIPTDLPNNESTEPPPPPPPMPVEKPITPRLRATRSEIISPTLQQKQHKSTPLMASASVADITQTRKSLRPSIAHRTEEDVWKNVFK